MVEFAEGIFRSDFLPHGWCYRWDPGVVWLHVLSDILIALSYYFIPFSLLRIVRRRRDLAYAWMFWLFGTFILACGTTHLMSVFVVWQPWYRLDGIIKLVTALVSVPTAYLLVRIAPAVIALPSPEQLRIINRRLEQEVSERKAAEAEVRRLNAELEQRVAERTRELEQANQRLHASEEQMKAILDGTPLLVYLKDPDDRLVFINKEFERAFGWRRCEVQGKRGDEIFEPEAAAAYRASDVQVWADRRVHEFEEYAWRDGEKRSYLSVKFPLFDGNSNPYALCGMSADITDRKRTEEALRRYNTELEQFAYVAAHDLQEPLRTVKSFTQLIAKRYGGSLDRDANDFVGYIVGGVDRMHELIRDLQTWSELNQPSSVEVTADAAEVLRETVYKLDADIKQSGAEISFERLPKLRINPAHLGQVFQNLISNAIKYRSAEPPRIRIEATPAGREWEFSVRDNGQGIDPRYANQIFGLFRRLHGREIPGTGIGLAIVKKIIDSSGGRIRVLSSLGNGADFRFTLPAASSQG